MCVCLQPGPEADSDRVMQRWGSNGGDGEGGGYGGDGGEDGDDDDGPGGGYGRLTLQERLAGAASHINGGGGATPSLKKLLGAAASGPAAAAGGASPAPLTPVFGRRQAQLLSGDVIEWVTPLSGSNSAFPGRSPAHGSPGAGSPLWPSAACKLQQVGGASDGGSGRKGCSRGTYGERGWPMK